MDQERRLRLFGGGGACLPFVVLRPRSWDSIALSNVKFRRIDAPPMYEGGVLLGGRTISMKRYR